jgi:ribose transport system permease protein
LERFTIQNSSGVGSPLRKSNVGADEGDDDPPQPKQVAGNRQPFGSPNLPGAVVGGQQPNRLSGIPRVARRLVVRLALQREAALAVFIIVGGAALAFESPEFLTFGNLHAVFLGMSVEAIVAVGMTVLLVSGGFDLSVGSVLALGGIVAGLLVLGGAPAAIAVLGAVVAGVAVGITNGLLVAKVGVNPLITTLGMLSVIQGVVLLLGGGFAVSGLPPSLTVLGQSVYFRIQAPIYFMVGFALIGDFLLRRSRLFRLVYYVGGNEQAARLTGIPVDRVKIAGYCLTAGLAAFGGIILAARFGAASVNAGETLPLDVITAVVIGGASLSGGSGTVLGAMLGVFLIQLINNAFNLLGVNVYWQPVVQGSVLILAVAADAIATRSQGRTWLFLRARSSSPPPPKSTIAA